MDSRYRSIHSIRSSLDLLNSSRRDEESFINLATEEIKELCAPFLTDISDWEEIMNSVNKQLEVGLATEDDQPKELKMLNTFVKEISVQRITGQYISLDIKGRYYRVLLITMSSEGDRSTVDETLYTIPKKIRTQSAEAFFKYIAETIYDFLLMRGLTQNSFELAASFNFPVEMRSLSTAYLIQWTKEFACDAVVGQDVCALLQNALDDLELDIRIRAIFNDTVGVLAACAAKDPECCIGLIVSTGINCCYYEKAKRIKRPFAKFAGESEIIINTECGGFGTHGSMDRFITEYDKTIDQASVAPGSQILEKMVSTLYIGELARLIIVDATKRKLLFNGHLPEKMNCVNSFTSQLLFDIDRDPPHVYLSTEVVLRERFKVNSIRKIDMVNIRFICRALVTRSGNFIGSAIACLINRMGRRRTTIAVDGAFFRFSQAFPAVLVETITKLIPYSYTFKLKLIDDGTGKGAAAIIASTKVNVMPTPRFTIFAL